MRKITFFLLALFCSVASKAQSVRITQGGMTTAPESGKVYVIECNSQQSFTTVMYDAGETPKAKKFTLEDGMILESKYLWKITPVGDGGGYAVQNYATDQYISIEGTLNGGAVKMKGEEATVLITIGDDDYVALKHMTTEQWIDMGYSGEGISTWSGGVGGSRRMRIYEISVSEVSDLDIALNSLVTVWTEYSEAHGTTVDESLIGTGVGQYSSEACEAYAQAMDYAQMVAEEGSGLSVDEVNAAIQAIKDAWAKVEASRVPYQQEIKPGYYVIKSALSFYKNVTIPGYEDEATGETVPETTKKQYFEKAIYADKTTPKWKTFEEKADFLFKIEESDSARAYVVKNMLNGLTWNTIKTFTAEETDTTLMFDYLCENRTMYADDPEMTKVVPVVYNIRFTGASDDKANTNSFIHAGGHAAGAGVAGNIVNWSCDAEADHTCATDWYLEPIAEDVALAWIDAASPVKVVATMIDSVNVIKNAFPTQKIIAEDVTTTLFEDEPLITSVDQLSSPMTELNEGSIAALIDNNANTFWHSKWSDGAQAPGSHYLSVSDIDATQVAFKITRRNVVNDHPVILSVYGYDTNNDELTKEEGTLLATCNIGYTSSTETKISQAFNTQGKTVLRFYNEESAPIANNRGYWHASEFQLYRAEQSVGATTPQATARAAELAALETAIAEWNEKAFNADSVVAKNQTAELEALFNKVNDAWLAWTAVYADPTPLRNAVAEVKEFAKGIVEGKNPGQWPAGAGASVITDAVEKAEAYSNTGTYTPAGMDDQVKAVTDAKAQVVGMANQVEVGKWYAIRFATEEEYEAHGWDKAGAVSSTQGDLYDNYVAPAENKPATVVDNVVTVAAEHAVIDNEDVRNGTELRFTEVNTDNENIAFRFVQMGDNLALQHASGWFVGTDGSLTNLPALFSTEAIGYGKSLIKVTRLNGDEITTGGASPSYLHAQVAAHKLVAWSATAIDSRSALYIEEIDGKVAAETEVAEDVRVGTIRFLTSPVDLAYSADADVQLYNFKGYEKTAEGVKVAFDKTDKAEAGKACLFVAIGDFSETPTAEDTVTVNLTLDPTHFAVQPDSTQALVGTYTYQWVEEEKMASTITIWKNEMQMASGKDNTDCSRDISAFEGAIHLDKAQAIESITGDLVIELEGEFDTTAIQDVIVNAINTNGKIYTIDGRYVGKGNLGTVRNLGRGIYIVNGVKIAVK